MDSFTYTISDGQGGTATATVNVSIPNIAPPDPVGGDIIGRIWEDVDEDGIQDADETDNFTGIQVLLLDDNGNVVGTTITDSNGEYRFEGLQPGSFRILIMSGEYTITPRYQGGGNEGNDVDEFGYSDLLTILPGSLFEIDAGLLHPVGGGDGPGGGVA